jgi:hypothetical protein
MLGYWSDGEVGRWKTQHSSPALRFGITRIPLARQIPFGIRSRYCGDR